MDEKMLGKSPPFFPPHEVNCYVDRHYDTQISIQCGVVVFFGIIFLLYGYRLFKLVLFLTGFVVGFLSLYLICNLYMDDVLKSNLQHKELIYLGISGGGGLVIGLFTLCCYYVGLILLGAALGWFLGMAFLPLIVYLSPYVASHSWVAYVVLISFSVVGAIVILLLQKIIIIVSTSFLGASSIMQGLDYFIEKSQVIYYVIEILYYGQTTNLPKCWYTWFVLSWIPFLFIIGLVVQFKLTGKNYDHRTGYQRPDTLVVIPVDSQELDQISTGDDQPLLSSYA